MADLFFELACEELPPRELGDAARSLAEALVRGLAERGLEATGSAVAFTPRRIRWVSIVHVMEVAGFNALPIVALLSFFIGMVIAYLGARILGDFGAAVFTVELVTFSVLREFAVVITAVLLAGRTDSSFTAEIGAMKMRQEIDAMRVMGIDPMEALVAPRVIAMLVTTPILTFAAMMSGIFGGLLVAWSELGVSPAMFFARISETVPSQHFWVGLSKAPAFAMGVSTLFQGPMAGRF